MLDAACGAKLATWACMAVATALKAHNVDVEFLAVLADLGGRTIEAGHALHDRPRDVLRKAADRLAARIAREHQAWLANEFQRTAPGRTVRCWRRSSRRSSACRLSARRRTDCWGSAARAGRRR